MPGQYNAGTTPSRVVLVDPATLNDYSASGGSGGTQVQGPVASGGANSANPVKVGAVYNTALPTPAAGQIVDLQADASGSLRARQVFTLVADGDAWPNTQIGRGISSTSQTTELLPAAAGHVFNGTNWDRQRGDVSGTVNTPHALAAARWSYAAAAGGVSNTTTAVTIKAAAGAGVRNYITSVQLSADTLGAATEVVVRDGAGGTVLWRGRIGTAGVSGVQSVPLAVPIAGTANTLLEVSTLTATVSGGVYFNCQGYTGA